MRCDLPPCLWLGLAAGLVDEDLAHGLGGCAEEVAAAFPAGVLVADQVEVRLVDQGGRGEGLPRGQPARQGGRQAAQFRVHGGQQLLGGLPRGCWGFVGPLHDPPPVRRDCRRTFLTLNRPLFG